MSRDKIRNQRLDRRTPAGVAAGAKATELFNSYRPTQCPLVANGIELYDDSPLTEADRELLVQYRIALRERTGKVFTGEDENFLQILGKNA